MGSVTKQNKKHKNRYKNVQHIDNKNIGSNIEHNWPKWSKNYGYWNNRKTAKTPGEKVLKTNPLGVWW